MFVRLQLFFKFLKRFMNNSIKDGDFITSTKLSLINSFKGVADLPSHFTSTELLSKPPYPFLQALVRLYVDRLGFARGLFKETELNIEQQKSKQQKIRFIIKILACVSKVTGERVDIFVSPAKLLAGKDVEATHKFIQALAKASKDIPKSCTAAISVIEEGENSLYKKAVRVRTTIVKIQAIIRGFIQRMGMYPNKSKHGKHLKEKEINSTIRQEIPKQAWVDDGENQTSDYHEYFQLCDETAISTSMRKTNTLDSKFVEISDETAIPRSNSTPNKTENEKISSSKDRRKSTTQPLMNQNCLLKNDDELNVCVMHAHHRKNRPSIHENIHLDEKSTAINKKTEEEIERDFHQVRRDLEDQISCLNIVMMNEKDRQKTRLRERLLHLSECTAKGYLSEFKSLEECTTTDLINIDNANNKPASAPADLHDGRSIETSNMSTSPHKFAPNDVSKQYEQKNLDSKDVKLTCANKDSATQHDSHKTESTSEEFNTSIKMLETRYKLQINKLKKRENILDKEKVELGGKTEKVTKLAESLRRQFCQMKKEREKMMEDAKRSREESRKILAQKHPMNQIRLRSESLSTHNPNTRASTAPCSKCSSTCKERSLFEEKGRLLKEKETRVLKLAETLRRQQRRLNKHVEKEKYRQKLIPGVNIQIEADILNKNHSSTFLSYGKKSSHEYKSWRSLKRSKTRSMIENLQKEYNNQNNKIEPPETPILNRVAKSPPQRRKVNKNFATVEIQNEYKKKIFDQRPKLIANMGSVEKNNIATVEIQNECKKKIFDQRIKPIKNVGSVKKKNMFPFDSRSTRPMNQMKLQLTAKSKRLSTNVAPIQSIAEIEHEKSHKRSLMRDFTHETELGSTNLSSIDLLEKEYIKKDFVNQETGNTSRNCNNNNGKSTENRPSGENKMKRTKLDRLPETKSIQSQSETSFHNKGEKKPKIQFSSSNFLKTNNLQLEDLFKISRKGKVSIDQFRQHILKTAKLRKKDVKKVVKYCLNNVQKHQYANKSELVDLRQLNLFLKREKLSKLNANKEEDNLSTQFMHKKGDNLAKYTNSHKPGSKNMTQFCESHLQEKSPGICNDWKIAFDNQMEHVLDRFETEYGLKLS